MDRVISACGVLCSGCAAYMGGARGLDHQRRAAAAWQRIYDYRQEPASITCAGCLSSDDEVFHTSRTCRARRCCRAKGLTNCGECDVEPCAALEHAQSVWDVVPALAASLSAADFAEYAASYCGHRERIIAIRRAREPRSTEG